MMVVALIGRKGAVGVVRQRAKRQLEKFIRYASKCQDGIMMPALLLLEWIIWLTGVVSASWFGRLLAMVSSAATA